MILHNDSSYLVFEVALAILSKIDFNLVHRNSKTDFKLVHRNNRSLKIIYTIYLISFWHHRD